MKFLRLFLSLTMGIAVSFFLAVNFFGYSTFDSPIDRLALLLVPALAIGLTLHQTFPSISAWTARIRSRFNLLYYLLGFLMSSKLAYGLVGYLQEPLRTPYNMVLLTVFLITPASIIGYYLFKRTANSFLNKGFLSKPLNILLVFMLPLAVSAVLYGSVRFPSMFTWEYITAPQKWTALFYVTALSAGIWSLAVLEKLDNSAIFEKVKQTSPVLFLSQNLPGLYAGGMFFLVHAILARALNHPALSYNTVLFEADAGPWMEILASPESAAINRSVHPLSLIIIRPLIRLVSGMMGDHYALGGMLVVSMVAGSCVFMTWLFVKRATDSKTYALLFAVLLGATASHMLFGALTENYIFGAASLILFFLLIQAGEKRFSVLVPAGLLLFGITITNIAQGIIGLFFNKFGFRRLVQYSVLILAIGVLLTVSTGILYPKAQTLFFVPADLAFEFNFVRSSQQSFTDRLMEKFEVVSRTMFLYGAVGPRPIEAVSEKPPHPTIDFKTFDVRTGDLAPYKGIANIPLALWLVLLIGGFVMFIKTVRISKHNPLMLGLLGALGFNFLMHMVYGTELFLYSPYWMYAIVLFLALALSEFAEKNWFQWSLSLIVIALLANNLLFLFTIIRGLSPFYAAVP